jgi:hypothetical protein
VSLPAAVPAALCKKVDCASFTACSLPGLPG